MDWHPGVRSTVSTLRCFHGVAVLGALGVKRVFVRQPGRTWQRILSVPTTQYGRAIAVPPSDPAGDLIVEMDQDTTEAVLSSDGVLVLVPEGLMPLKIPLGPPSQVDRAVGMGGAGAVTPPIHLTGVPEGEADVFLESRAGSILARETVMIQGTTKVVLSCAPNPQTWVTVRVDLPRDDQEMLREVGLAHFDRLQVDLYSKERGFVQRFKQSAPLKGFDDAVLFYKRINVPRGSYRFTLRPFGYSEDHDLSEGVNQGVRIRCPHLGIVYVSAGTELLESCSAQPVPPATGEGIFGEVGRDGEIFVVAPPGTYDVRGRGRNGEAYQGRVDVLEGWNSVALERVAQTSVTLTAEMNGTEIALPDEYWDRLEVHRVSAGNVALAGREYPPRPLTSSFQTPKVLLKFTGAGQVAIRLPPLDGLTTSELLVDVDAEDLSAVLNVQPAN